MTTAAVRVTKVMTGMLMLPKVRQVCTNVLAFLSGPGRAVLEAAALTTHHHHRPIQPCKMVQCLGHAPPM